MKALSLTQPWATAVALGLKQYETRSWPTAFRGPVLIHASKGFPRWAKNMAMEFAVRYDFRLTPDFLPLGKLQPRPELVDAIKQFIPYVIEICELPKSYAEKTSVTGISFTETTVDDMEVIGIVVTAQKKLTKTNGPMVINTPFLVDVGWPSYTQAAVEKLEEEAMRFRRGDRAQQPLPMRVAKKAGN